MEMPIISARRWTREALFVALVLLVLGVDQLTKFLVRTYMEVGESVPEDGIIRLTYIQNTGSAFGLFASQTLVLTIAAAVGVGLIVYFLVKGGGASTLLSVSLVLQLGGAIGNLIDRLAFGYVVDFADLRVWPIFNVADSSITIGFLLLAWVLLTGKDKKGRARDVSQS